MTALPPRAPTGLVDADVLQEVNRLNVIARVVSNTAHDLNNALQVIGGSAEFLALRREPGPAEQRRIAAIATQTGRAAAILDRLVGYARVDAADRRVQDLTALVDTALALRDFSLHRAGIAVTIDRAIPPPCRAAVSRPRILQVFLNVLLNAETALHRRPDGTIQITVARSGSDWIVSFADNGQGISAEQRARVSDAAAVPPLRQGLAGIGLWVSRRIAEQHGGRLEIAPAPAPATGTVVTLALPAV
jgi:signal transduction histidine kinase